MHTQPAVNNTITSNNSSCNIPGNPPKMNNLNASSNSSSMSLINKESTQNLQIKTLQEYRNKLHGITDRSASKSNMLFNNVILFYKLFSFRIPLHPSNQ